MNQRRNFLKAAAAALPLSAAVVATNANAADGDVKDILGAWSTLHTSPFGPFRELLVFNEGGGLTETNILLHTNSRLAYFAQFAVHRNGGTLWNYVDRLCKERPIQRVLKCTENPTFLAGLYCDKCLYYDKYPLLT